MQVSAISNMTFAKGEAYSVEKLSKEIGVPVYHACTTHAFNRIVGYARFKNALSGTVLYRGQNKAYKSLIPSGARENKTAVADEVIDTIRKDAKLRRFFALDQPEILGWRQYERTIVEATLQHYGANTYCMDFVDNHWCALWFGLHRFNHTHYVRRNDNDNLYIYLYVADTLGPCIKGVYIGSNTITVDLRKAIPSTFQRPSSQHGWVIKNTERSNRNLNENLIGIIEVSVPDANEWLGIGTLLSEDNFFPSFKNDQGYSVLLQRQKRSGLPSKSLAEILPINTIQNYHFSELLYSTKETNMIKPTQHIPFVSDDSDHVLADMLARLWESGWQKETCFPEDKWNEKNPIIGQSAATAILVQRYFGGKIASFIYSNRTHYFNILDNNVIDLTHGELVNGRDNNYGVTELSYLQTQRLMKKADVATNLLNNCCMESR